MNIGWEDKLKKELMKEISAVDFPEETQEEVLNHVHRQIRKRRIRMKMSRKSTGIILAAALVVIGSITTIGAGKIAFTSGGHSRDEEMNNLLELTKKAEKELGENPEIPEKLSEELVFSSGVVNYADAWDEEHQKVGSFPEAMVYYGAGNKITLTITKPLEADNGNYRADQSETYKDRELSGRIDQYLFLPPEQEASEEDKQLQAEGNLFISYGSSEEERETFTSVSWTEGDLRYLLATFEDVELKEMMEWAKAVIDSGSQNYSK